MTIPLDSISSEIDFTTDTSEEDPNIINDSINNSMNKMYRQISKHKIINNK